mgnify:CR=1 FL=1
MKFFTQMPSSAVFLLPVVALVVGLISVDADNDRAQALYDARFQERLQADASLRLTIRDLTVEAALKDLDELHKLLSARSFAGVDILSDAATDTLINSYGERLSMQHLHLIVGSATDGDDVYVDYAFPRRELVGKEISNHPMLEGFDVGLTPPFIDQIAYRASKDNDLSYTSQGALAIRRILITVPNLDEKLVVIVKVNALDIQRATDAFLRELGPIPALRSTHIAPDSNACLMYYSAGVGERPCPAEALDSKDIIVSEKFGVRVSIAPTEAYIREFEGGRPSFAYTGLLVTLIATGFAWLIAVFFRRRLGESERELRSYRDLLDSKDELTAALHTMVIDNLAQVSKLARRVKRADGIDTEERRYLNIALSEIGQLRLSLDAQVMADAAGRGDLPARVNEGTLYTKALCQSVRRELVRVADDEGIECRLLADDELPETLPGSQYWIESAALALINASQSFTDEGFIELSVWVENSMQGQPELYVRCRDTGISWSAKDDGDHAAVALLTNIVSGLGAELTSKPLQSGAGQEHSLRFIRR